MTDAATTRKRRPLFLLTIEETYPVTTKNTTSKRANGTTGYGPQRPEVWSFFTGAMGLDLGLELAGIQPTLAVEVNPVYCSTARLNRPALDVWEADVNELDGDSLHRRRPRHRDVFMMVGGPPCQSFSPGGKRAALSDPRGNLIYSYLRLIEQVQPRYFVLENVANILTAALKHRPIAERPGKNWNLSSYHDSPTNGDESAPAMQPDELSGSAIRQIFADVNQLGYSITFGVLDSSEFGAPQKRFRFIMLGARRGPSPAIPQATRGEHSRDGLACSTVRQAIYDLRNCPGPHSEYTPEVAQYFALVPPGGNWRQLPKELQREALGTAAFKAGGGKTGFYRRLAWDAPAPTITGRANRKGSAVCHPEQTRPLSVRECARLQGFPDEWKFEGSMSDQYMQVGNAVPVCLGHAVGSTILEHFKTHARSTTNAAPDVEIMLGRAIAKLRASARNKRGGDANQLPLFSSSMRTNA